MAPAEGSKNGKSPKKDAASASSSSVSAKYEQYTLRQRIRDHVDTLGDTLSKEVEELSVKLKKKVCMSLDRCGESL